MRDEVPRAIEPLRKDKQIGSSLRREVVAVGAGGETLALLEQYAADLPMLFIVSEVALRNRRRAEAATRVAIERAGGVKCERCWRYVPTCRPSRLGRTVCERRSGRAGGPVEWHDDHGRRRRRAGGRAAS